MTIVFKIPDIVDVPSCIESLVASGHKLHCLANQVCNYYIKASLLHVYKLNQTNGPSNNDGHGSKCDLVKSKNETILFLKDLTDFVESAFDNLEITFRRLVYHLNSIDDYKSIENDKTFKLSNDTRLEPIASSIMDLLYALVSLEFVIESHTSFNKDIIEFQSSAELCDKEMQTIQEISATLRGTNKGSNFLNQICHRLKQLQLTQSGRNTALGYSRLCNLIPDAIIYFTINLATKLNLEAAIKQKLKRKIDVSLMRSLNLLMKYLTPTSYMLDETRMLFGITCLLIVYCWLVKDTDYGVCASVIQLIQKTDIELHSIPIFGSCNKINLHAIAFDHLVGSNIDTDLLAKLKNFSRIPSKLNLADEFSNLQIKFRSWKGNIDESYMVPIDFDKLAIQQKWPRIFDLGIKFIRQAKVIYNMCIYEYNLDSGTRIDLGLKLIPMIKQVNMILYHQIKSQYRSYEPIGKDNMRSIWLKKLSIIRQRLLALKYSARKLNLTSTVVIINICSSSELFDSPEGIRMICFCLLMLLPSLTNDEITELGNILESISTWDSGIQKLNQISYFDNLYWSLDKIYRYYDYCLRHDLRPGRLQNFLIAIEDIPKLFQCLPNSMNSNNGKTLRMSNLVTLDIAQDIEHQFQVMFIEKLYEEFKSKVKIQAHIELYGRDENHIAGSKQLINFDRILSDSKPLTLRLFDRIHSIKKEFELRLSQDFKLTNELKDCHIWDRIEHIVGRRYNLRPKVDVNSKLGLHHNDVDWIIENLFQFACCYSYDHVNQIFIEKLNHIHQSTRMDASSSVSSQISASASVTLRSKSTVAPSMDLSKLNHINFIGLESCIQYIRVHGLSCIDAIIENIQRVITPIVKYISETMAEGRVQSILLKELKRINDPKDMINISTRPALKYDRVEEIIKKLQQTNRKLITDGQNFKLETIRQSIIRLGNLLAFVGLICDASIVFASTCVNYLPDKHKSSQKYSAIGKWTQLVDGPMLNIDDNLHSTLDSFRKNSKILDDFTASLDQVLTSDVKEKSYKKLSNVFVELEISNCEQDLVDIKSPDESNTEKSSYTKGQSLPVSHMGLFYLIAPALLIEYTDYIMCCRESLLSKSIATTRLPIPEAISSDDGFSIGMAFMFLGLGQVSQFKQLQWFDEVEARFNEEISKVKLRSASNDSPESYRQTSTLTLIRLSKLKLEHESLKHSLNNCMLIFAPSST